MYRHIEKKIFFKLKKEIDLDLKKKWNIAAEFIIKIVIKKTNL